MASVEDELAAKYHGAAEEDLAAKYQPPDFSDVHGGVTDVTQNTYQMENTPRAGRAMGLIAGLPKGPELAAYIQSKVGSRQVTPEEMKTFLSSQQSLTPGQYGQGEAAGKIAPAVLAAIATKGASLAQQAGAQGLTAYLQSRLGGKDIAPSALEGGLATGLTGAGGLVAKGVGLAANDTASWLAPRLKELAQSAILKQSGFATKMGSLFKRKGEEGLAQMAEDLGPHIRPTVQWTARNLENIVDDAETVRGTAVRALDKALENNEAMPTLGNVVDNAKTALGRAVQADPTLTEHAVTVGKTLDNFLNQWGADSKSFASFDTMRRKIADLGKFDNTVAQPLQRLYRATSAVIRRDIDTTAGALAPGDEAKDLVMSKGVLHSLIEPANKAAERAHEMGSHSVLGIPGSMGLSGAASLLAAGRPGAAAVAGAGALLQKPARQFANYGFARGANAAANYLGSEAPGVGGFLTSGSGETSTGVAGSLMSKRLYPDQVGQLAERLGAPQAAQLKRAAETDPSNADALHKYMLANNQDYQAVMGTAGTSKDRRQP